MYFELKKTTKQDPNRWNFKLVIKNKSKLLLIKTWTNQLG